MPAWKTMFESSTDWLSASDLDDDGLRTLTIDRVEAIGIESDKGVRSRPVLHFRERVKPMITCSTVCQCIEVMHGADTDGWAGKPITLWYDPAVTFGRETVGGLRVKGAPGLGRSVTATIILPKRRPSKVTLIDTTPRGDRRPDGQPQSQGQTQPTTPPIDDIATELGRYGLTVAELDAASEAGGKAAPSTLPAAGQARVLAFLRSEAGQARLQAMRDEKAGAATI